MQRDVTNNIKNKLYIFARMERWTSGCPVMHHRIEGKRLVAENGENWHRTDTV